MQQTLYNKVRYRILGGVCMTEKRLNNTIYLMDMVTKYYCKEKNITIEEFLQLDKQYDILNYVAECPDVFDPMSYAEIVEEIEQYVAEN